MEEYRDSLISAKDNKQMFNRIANKYDTLNKVLSFGLDKKWRRKAVDILAPQTDSRYLDVGCGPGDMAIQILKTRPNTHVVGLDPSVEMLRMGQLKISEAQLDEFISLKESDAMNLPFGDGSYDGAVCAFCLRNVENRRVALSEMYRVLKPGSKAVILELTRPATRLLRMMHRLYNSVWVPLVGWCFSRTGAYKYLVQSIESFPPELDILAGMNEAGFIHTSCYRLTGGVVTVFKGEK